MAGDRGARRSIRTGGGPGGLLARVTVAAILGTAAATAVAQSTYPAKPIRLVIPFPAGGGVDVVGRIVGQRLGDQLGQQLLVDNRVGASGNIAAEIVATANPDGHTLFFALDSVLTANPHLYRKLAFDPVASFAPVSRVGTSQFAVVVSPSLPVKDLQEFIGLARAKPGQLNFGSAGTGSTAHLAAELLVHAAGIRMIHVPYKGSPQAMTDLAAGQVQMATPTVPAAMGLIRGGKVRALAVSGPKRTPAAPDIPTAAEAGLPAYQIEFWVAILAPARTPGDIVTRLLGETRRALEDTEVRASLLRQGMEAAPSTPEELLRIIREDTGKWGKVIRSAGIAPAG